MNTKSFLLIAFYFLLSAALSAKEPIDVKFYDIELDVTDKNNALKGSCAVAFEALADADSVDLSLAAKIRVDSVSGYNFSRVGDKIWIKNAFKMGENYSVKLHYFVPASNENNFMTAVQNGRDKTSKISASFTTIAPRNAYQWFPCHAEPTDKADSLSMRLNVPFGRTGVSQGKLRSVKLRDDGSITYHWTSNYPTAYHLISFAVGKFREQHDYLQARVGFPEVRIVNYLYDDEKFIKENAQNLSYAPMILDFLQSIYGPYPYAEEKLGQVSVPLGGGMENQTVISLGSFHPLLVVHEMAHQWFGDCVTPATFQDIWLSEGFATYTEQLFIERYPELVKDYFSFVKGKLPDNLVDVYRWETIMNARTQENNSIFIPAEFAENEDSVYNYDLSYQKGAMVIHQLRREIGDDEIFLKVLRTYLDTYKHSSASIRDFQAVAEKVSGKDFGRFFEQWIYGKGYPIITFALGKKDNKAVIKLQQKGSSDATPIFDCKVDVALTFSGGHTETHCVDFKQAEEVFYFEIPEGKDFVAAALDPHNQLLCELKFFNPNDKKNSKQEGKNGKSKRN